MVHPGEKPAGPGRNQRHIVFIIPTIGPVARRVMGRNLEPGEHINETGPDLASALEKAPGCFETGWALVSP